MVSHFLSDFFNSYRLAILIAAFILLFIAESFFKLRKRFQPRLQRIIINAILSIPAFALARLILAPALIWLAFKNETWHLGVNYLYNLPSWVENIIAFILIDYSMYWWHIILHKMPLMWRFHLVHHTDVDMDVTTAFRFHFGEIIGSVIFRSAVVLLIGISPIMLLMYELIFEIEIQFHHSNTKLPIRFERILNYIIVTPRMHGIHHSVIKQETESNYASIFSFWDRLHKTIRLNIHQHEIVIGVPAYHDADELTVGNLLKIPFTKIREWKETERKNDVDYNELKQ